MGKAQRRTNKKGEALTKQQLKFCEQYALSGNGAESYGIAYPTSMKHTPQYRAEYASKLLKRAKIRTKVDEFKPRAAKVLEKHFDITAENVLQEIAAIAHYNADDYFEWGYDEVPQFSKNGEPLIGLDGNQRTERVPYAVMKPSKDLTRLQKKAIAAVGMNISRTGEIVLDPKMLDKMGALKTLAQHLGLLKHELNLSGKGGGPVQLVISQAESAL